MTFQFSKIRRFLFKNRQTFQRKSAKLQSAVRKKMGSVEETPAHPAANLAAAAANPDSSGSTAAGRHAPLYPTTAAGMQAAKENHKIFEEGSLLHHVQVSDVLHDGKEYVDKPALYSPFTILASWARLMAETGGDAPSDEQILTFVEAHFGESGWELTEASPEDLTGRPAYLDGIEHQVRQRKLCYVCTLKVTS